MNGLDDRIKASRILVVDDEPPNVRLLDGMLRRAGFTHVTGTTDSREAAPLFASTEPDLVLLDLLMPYLDGFEVLAQLGDLTPPGVYLPILVLTADVTKEARERALSEGAKDFLTKPFDVTEVLLRIRNLLETRHLHIELQRHMETEFITHVSHELRTPLTAFSAALEMLLDEVEPLPPTVKQFRDIALRNAARLDRMVTNLSAAASLVDDTLLVEPEPVALESIVAPALRAGAPEAAEHEVHVTADIPTALPHVRADPARAFAVVSNLVANAIEHSPPGAAVTVAASADGTPGFVHLSVRDEGEGFDPETIEHLFDRFAHVTSEREDESRLGLGLGLWLCKAIVTRHGGQLWAESEPGKGATFHVTFPAC